MSSSETVETYARALFELASVDDAVDRADVALAAAVKAVRGHVELTEVLKDTAMPSEKKRDILRDIFGDGDPAVLSIVGLLADTGRIDMIGEVANAFSAIAEKERGKIVVEVTTVVEITDALRASLSDKLSAAFGRPVVLRERVDASLVGGIVIRVAGRVLDASAASQIDAMRLALASAQGGEA